MHLERGDTIGVISTSSPVGYEELKAGVNFFKNLGFNTRIGRNVYSRSGSLSGKDNERISDLQEFFNDKSVRAIFCSRGGYGSIRLLDRIDYDLIKDNPKIFVGYSDVTALELAFFSKTGMVSFYGPMLSCEFNGETDISSLDKLLPVLLSEKENYKIHFTDEDVVNKGSASGILIGGCLSIFCSLLGGPYLPDLNGALLFLEDANEKPYRIDRLLSQVKMAGVFDKINGILFGQFSHCEPQEDNSPTVDDVISDICSGLTIPVAKNLPFGHIKDKITLPLGINATLNTDERFFSFDENAVI